MLGLLQASSRLVDRTITWSQQLNKLAGRRSVCYWFSHQAMILTSPCVYRTTRGAWKIFFLHRIVAFLICKTLWSTNMTLDFVHIILHICLERSTVWNRSTSRQPSTSKYTGGVESTHEVISPALNLYWQAKVVVVLWTRLCLVERSY